MRRLLVLSGDSAVADEARGTAAAHGLEVVRCASLGELEAHAREGGADVALLDAGDDPVASLRSAEPRIAALPETRFVVLCRELGSEVVLEAMHAGARHCVARGRLADDLADALPRLLRDPSANGTEGRLATVLSASGGCGATTVAVNLAEELRLETSRPVLLVDMDAAYGAAAGYLGLSGSFGLVDVLARPDPIDANLLQSSTTSYGEGFDVLLGPASVRFDDPDPIPFDRLGAGARAFRRAYASTVIDAARVPMSAAADLARASALTLVVFQLDVVDVRTTRAIVSALAARSVPPSRIVPVVNRYRKRKSMLSLDDARRALGVDEVALVRNDWEGACRSINFGKPLARVAPRSPFRKDVRELAGLVARADAAPAGNGAARVNGRALRLQEEHP